MNFKDTLKQIFSKNGIDPKTVGVKFEEETTITLVAENQLEDGTAIYSTADAWAEGVDVYTKDADGNPVPLAEGEYMCADGTKLMVGADGKVAAIEMPEVETEDMSSEDLLNVISTLSERVSALETANTQLSSQVSTEQEVARKAVSDLNTVKAELAALKKKPATESVTEQKLGKEKQSQNNEVKVGSPEWFMQFTSQTAKA